MKFLRSLLAAIVAAAFVHATAAEAGGSPAGNWQWTATGPLGAIEVSAHLEHHDGALTGTITARGGSVAIAEGSYQEAVVAFTVIRELNGQQFFVKYSGKLAGDTITGMIDRPTPDGGRQQVEWKASRVK
jgi:hypothetical protein